MNVYICQTYLRKKNVPEYSSKQHENNRQQIEVIKHAPIQRSIWALNVVSFQKIKMKTGDSVISNEKKVFHSHEIRVSPAKILYTL